MRFAIRAWHAPRTSTQSYPRADDAAGLLVIGMNLYREFLVREEKLQQQWEAPRVAGGVAHKLALVFRAELRQCLPGKRPIPHLAIVASKPRFSNLFRELVVG